MQKWLSKSFYAKIELSNSGFCRTQTGFLSLQFFKRIKLKGSASSSFTFRNDSLASQFVPPSLPLSFPFLHSLVFLLEKKLFRFRFFAPTTTTAKTPTTLTVFTVGCCISEKVNKIIFLIQINYEKDFLNKKSNRFDFLIFSKVVSIHKFSSLVTYVSLY